MGNANAYAMAASVGEGEVGFTDALIWHLTCNHFPPVHTIFVDAAKEAIRAAAAEDFDQMIERPGTAPAMPAIDIVEQLHLWAFVDNADALPPAE